jgi:hypothetical protein
MRQRFEKQLKPSTLIFGLAIAAAPVLGLAVATVPASAVQNPAETSGPKVAVPNPSVIVLDQKLDPKDGNSIKITYVYVPKKSFVVVHGSDAQGAIDQKSLGQLALEPGDHRDVKVPLTNAEKAGTKLWITLNQNVSNSGKLEPKTDVSYWAAGEVPLANSFLIK